MSEIVIKTKRLKLKLEGSFFNMYLQGKYIGYIRLSTPNIAWKCEKEYRNQGYTTEAAQAIINYSFRNNTYKIISAVCFRNHKASERIMQKIGMKNISVPEINMTRYEIRK